MTHISQILLLIALFSTTQAYFQDKDHREKAKIFLKEFVAEFTDQFDTITAEGLDHIGAMRLAFDYWITKLKLTNFSKFAVNYDVDHDLVEINAPNLSLELIIEDKYNIPVKVEDLQITIIFDIDESHFRCTDVEIDYASVSLDLNIVVEYLSRQLLSLDMVKNAIKAAETPLRNVFIQAIRSNFQRLHGLLINLKDDALDAKSLVSKLPEAHHIRIENKEFIFNIRSMFGYESLREKDEKQDL